MIIFLWIVSFLNADLKSLDIHSSWLWWSLQRSSNNRTGRFSSVLPRWNITYLFAQGKFRSDQTSRNCSCCRLGVYQWSFLFNWWARLWVLDGVSSHSLVHLGLIFRSCKVSTMQIAFQIYWSGHWTAFHIRLLYFCSSTRLQGYSKLQWSKDTFILLIKFSNFYRTHFVCHFIKDFISIIHFRNFRLR